MFILLPPTPRGWVTAHHDQCTDVCHPRWLSPGGGCLPFKLGTSFPSTTLSDMAWLALPQWSSVQSCRTLWKQGVEVSPFAPLAHWASLPLCQPCSFFPPGQAGFLLASQCLLQSQVTSPPQKHFLAPPSLLTSVSFATECPQVGTLTVGPRLSSALSSELHLQ